MERAVMTESIVQETLEATMRDGTVLRSDVWRPSGGGRYPVLLIRLPYDKSAFALAFNASWATFLADDVARRRDPDSEPLLAAQYAKVNDYYWWLPLSAIPNLTPGSPGGFFADWLAHETKDDYWKRWDVTTKLPSIDVPAMAVGGLYDVFLEGTMANYSGIRRGPASADTGLVIGPWYHMPWR